MEEKKVKRIQETEGGKSQSNPDFVISQLLSKAIPPRIVVDGPNILHFNPDSNDKNPKPDASRLLSLLKSFGELGFKEESVRIILNASLTYKSKNKFILVRLRKKGVVVVAPSGDYDDKYCISLARRYNAIIISNDKYEDLIRQDRSLGIWLNKYRVGFSITEDRFVLSKHFMHLLS